MTDSGQQRTILHVDMDAFFAAVEQLDNPDLRGKPVIVGGLGPRGVVSTASYEARPFGVHSALPMARARRLCPGGVYLAPRMERYREISAQVFEVFQRYTPEVEGLSLDEAFLDASGSLRLFGSGADIARRIQADIRAETGLSASVGVAHNKFLAKLASDLDKPAGLTVIEPDRVQRMLDPMPVKRLWGVGVSTERRLRDAGILTFGQLRRAQPQWLQSVLGNRAAALQALAAGRDDRPVVRGGGRDRSVSHETTFDHDIRDPDILLEALQRLSEAVGRRLRRKRLAGRTVNLKIRDQDFRTMTRSHTVSTPLQDGRSLYREAKRLLRLWLGEHRGTPVRLLGMGVSNLVEAAAEKSEPGVDEALDSIRDRFGDGTIRRGRG